MNSLVVSDRTGLIDAQLVNASNACGALAGGFAIATVLLLSGARLRRWNAGAAIACGLAAAALRAASHNVPSHTPRDAALLTEASLAGLDYSIVIPAYNRPDYVARLLGRIEEQARGWSGLGAGEIVVVDDGSVDDTADVARRMARTLPLPTRVVTIAHSGPGAARNAGFVAARGAVGVSIDSDCLPDENWLPGLLAAVRGNPKTVAFACVRSPGKLAYPIENAPDRKGFVSASFALDRAAFCRLGGFYAGYGMSHEDLDFVQVTKNAGYDVVRAESTIDHPLRRENAASIWRVGLNSKYANLFVRRHGRNASGITRTTPYYFFGIGGNYGSSIAFVIAALNVLLAIVLNLTSRSFAADEFPNVRARFAAAAALYVVGLAALGLRVGAGLRRLPNYVMTLGTFQLATTLGRLKGSLEYGMLLL